MTRKEKQFLLGFLDALVGKPCGMSADDASSDLRMKHVDGGKWKGPLVRSLAADGLIRPIGAVKSRRLARNGGLLHQWVSKDHVAVIRRRDSILASLTAQEAERPATQLTLPGLDSLD